MSVPDDPDSPEAWLWIARVDLESAKHLLANSSIPPMVACYHAHQAAEKAIKAGLVALEVDFPYTHNIEVLLTWFPADWDLHHQVEAVARLSEYEFTTRYPALSLLEACKRQTPQLPTHAA